MTEGRESPPILNGGPASTRLLQFYVLGSPCTVRLCGHRIVCASVTLMLCGIKGVEDK